ALYHTTIHAKRRTSRSRRQRAGNISHERSNLVSVREPLDERGRTSRVDELLFRLGEGTAAEAAFGSGIVRIECRAGENAVDGYAGFGASLREATGYGNLRRLAHAILHALHRN